MNALQSDIHKESNKTKLNVGGEVIIPQYLNMFP